MTALTTWAATYFSYPLSEYIAWSGFFLGIVAMVYTWYQVGVSRLGAVVKVILLFVLLFVIASYVFGSGAATWILLGVLGIMVLSYFYPSLLEAPSTAQRRTAGRPRTSYKPSRPPIPPDVKGAVWRRDGGMCVQCGSTQNLEFDHNIPYSKGGAHSVGNLQILCRSCNRSKGARI